MAILSIFVFFIFVVEFILYISLIGMADLSFGVRFLSWLNELMIFVMFLAVALQFGLISYIYEHKHLSSKFKFRWILALIVIPVFGNVLFLTTAYRKIRDDEGYFVNLSNKLKKASPRKFEKLLSKRSTSQYKQNLDIASSHSNNGSTKECIECSKEIDASVVVCPYCDAIQKK